MNEQYNKDKDEIKVDNIDIKIDNIGINDYKIEEAQRKVNKAFKQKRINAKTSVSEDIFPSEEGLIHVRNKLAMKDDDDLKTIDFIKEQGIKESTNEFINHNLEANNKEAKKGFFERNFGWVNYLFHEIPLLWKKEELVKGYDANGNIVYRPKKKIPIRKGNKADIEKVNVENEANYKGLDYTKKGINYAVYFN